MPFDPAAFCYGSVREHCSDNPTKKEKITQGVSKPNFPTFNAKTINAQAQSVELSEQERSTIGLEFLPSAFFISFSHFVIFLSSCFLQSALQSRANSARSIFKVKVALIE